MEADYETQVVTSHLCEYWADNNAALHMWRVTHPLGGDAIDHIHISRETSVAG